MINHVTYKLAAELAPDFDKASEDAKEVFINWAERILERGEGAPDFLMAKLTMTLKQRTRRYSEKRESKILKEIRQEYEFECLSRMSGMSHQEEHQSYA